MPGTTDILLTIGGVARRGAGRARRGAVPGGATSTLPEVLRGAFAENNIEIVAEQETSPASARRSAATTDTMTFRLSVDDDARYALAVRHPSGAITFHAPSNDSGAPAAAASRKRVVRRGVTARRELTFDVRSRSAAGPESGRRGVVSTAIKTVVLKVATKLVDRALPRLAAFFEARLWQKRGLEEGWYRISTEGISPKPLTPEELARALIPNEQRSLLLIHGTFSDAGTYLPLTTGGANSFIERVKPIYGDRTFAYNHFTVSKTPLENAKELAAALPASPTTFDVITHSRGGLVLRTLLEEAGAVGPAASRIRVERAVLVACPSDGTPLATADRWDKTFGWFANLLELFPDNPFTTAAGFVAESINWLAGRVVGRLPGLVAMDTTGETVSSLQHIPTPAPRGYAALAAHYEASDSILKRLADVGIDAFFALDNDLVVPTRGSWSVRSEGTRNIDAGRIGCFGPGGNLVPGTTDRVFHTNFFVQPETVEFLLNVLNDRPTGLEAIDLEKQTGRRLAAAAAAASVATGLPVLATALPTSTPRVKPMEVVPAAAVSAAVTSRPASGVLVEPMGASTAVPTAVLALPAGSADLGIASPTDFQIVVLPPPPGQKSPVSVLATYGSARVHDILPTSGEADGAGKRWHDIIQTQMGIRNYVSGAPGAELPDEEGLKAWGEQLFAAMLPGNVRRLYDDARARFRDRRMTVVFTSMIPWIADKPWEFAFDPTRKTYLATEEIHFVRNVLTAVPAEEAEPITAPLRILVVSAQPVGLGRLSIEEETEVIKRGFQPLIDSGRAIVDVLPSATPAAVHARVYTGNYHVVHLIAHGEFVDDSGFVIFQDRNGTTHRIGDRKLREILCGRGIRLVFLNACDTGQGGHADFNSGVAPALVAGGMPAVIANQYSVLDVSATVFAQHFYWSIAQGFTLGSATREARIAVNYSLKGEAIDWAIPVLYARDASMRLCQRILGGSPVAQLRTTSGRRSTSQHAIHVAVWDVSHFFPRLNRVLERMNAAQQRFGFEAVDLSVPVGTLRQVAPQSKTKANERQTYLYADEAAAKLAAYPGQLGVNYLACLVGVPMMYTSSPGKVTVNAYDWWEKDIPVFMFSAANFDLKPDSPETDRAVANGLVASLAGARAGMDAHDTNRNCLLYTNNERDIDLVTGVKRFCETICLKTLRSKTPEDLAAYDAILDAFGHAGQPKARAARPSARKSKGTLER